MVGVGIVFRNRKGKRFSHFISVNIPAAGPL